MNLLFFKSLRIKAKLYLYKKPFCMGKVITKNKKTPNTSKKKAIDMKLFLGKVKAFRDVNALTYQKKSREE